MCLLNEHLLSTCYVAIAVPVTGTSMDQTQFFCLLDLTFKGGSGILTVKKNICIKEWWQKNVFIVYTILWLHL